MLALLLTMQLFAQEKPKQILIGKPNETLTLEQAWHTSSKGETVYKCQEIKASVSKSGTSITFKVVK